MKISYTVLIAFLILMFNRAGGTARLLNDQDSVVHHENFRFSGVLRNGHVNLDTVFLRIAAEFGPGNGLLNIDTTYSIPLINHRFSITLPARKDAQYITLISNDKGNGNHKALLIYQNFVEAGDNIYMDYDLRTKKAVYTGVGAAKFNFIEARNILDNHLLDSISKYQIDEHPRLFFASQQFRLEKELELLNAYQNRLNSFSYNLLKADLVAGFTFPWYELLGLIDLGKSYSKPLGNEVDSLFKVDYLDRPIEPINPDILRQSIYYPSYLMVRAKTAYKYRQLNSLPNDENMIRAIQRECSGVLMDKVIMFFIYNQLSFSRLSDEMIAYALSVIKEKNYHELLSGIQRSRGRNSRVAGFDFPDQTGKNHQMTEYKGKVVLLDMWFTGCEGCVAVAAALPQVEEAFHGDSNVVFLSLNVDKSKDTWLKSINPKMKINNSYTHYTTASTKYFYTGGTGTQNEYIKKYNPSNSYPCLMLIGKNGLIYTLNPPVPGQDNQRLIDLIRKALVD